MHFKEMHEEIAAAYEALSAEEKVQVSNYQSFLALVNGAAVNDDETLRKEGTVAVIQGSDGSYVQYSTLQEAVSTAVDGDTIDLVSNSIALTQALVVDKNITLTGGTLTRDTSNTKHLIKVTTGTLTLKDITIDGSSSGDVKTSMVYVAADAKLVIGSGATLHKNKNAAVFVKQDSLTKYTVDVDGNEADGTDYAGGIYTYGGEIVLDGGIIKENVGQLGGGIGAYNGKITIKSGKVSQNMAYWNGGGVYSKYAEVDMAGGAITENTVGVGDANRVSNPKPNGGGVYVAYAAMTMSGGEITHNKALNWLGGGIFISGALDPAEFNMTGGSVNYNYAQVSGGGIYIECGTAATMDGEIEVVGNEAKGISLYNGWYYYAGGGIYVNGGVKGYPDATLTIKNVIITENTAAANGEYTGNDTSNRGYAYGYGSGLAVCNTGDVKLYLTDGGAIYKNQSKSTAANGKYNDVQVYITKGNDVDLRISEYMLGGSEYNWLNWSGTKEVDVNTLSRASTIFLYPKPTEDAIHAAEALGTIIVRGNQTDSMGGGVAVNGSLVVGTENAGSLSVHKTVSGSGGSTTKEFTFTVRFTGDDLADSYPCTVTDPDEAIESGKLDLTDGVGTFKLKHDQTIAITGLPAGTAFEVTESEGNGYTVTSQFGEQTASSTMTGTIPDDGVCAVNFNNYKDSGPVDSYTSVSVKKVWKLDDGGTAADSVKVALLRNGTEYETVTLDDSNNWSYTWSRLNDKYNWTVQEVEVPDGFTAFIDRASGNSFTITNNDEPSTPDNPDNPDDPDEPDNPDIPDEPGNPDNPDIPNTPNSPNTPAEPGLPQTGQRGWPVELPLIFGVAMLLAGLMDMGKHRYHGKHEK